MGKSLTIGEFIKILKQYNPDELITFEDSNMNTYDISKTKIDGINSRKINQNDIDNDVYFRMHPEYKNKTFKSLRIFIDYD